MIGNTSLGSNSPGHERMDIKALAGDLHLGLTHDILKCCFEVMNELGSGFLESVYQNALLVSLNNQGIKACSEKPFDVYFKNQKVGCFVPDIIVENTVIIELKYVSVLLPEHQAQLINYLKTTHLPIGLLINFGNRKLQYKRLLHPLIHEETNS